MTTEKDVLEECKRLNLTEGDLQMIEAFRDSIRTKADRDAIRSIDWTTVSAAVHTAEALRLSGRLLTWFVGSVLATIIVINQMQDELSKAMAWILGR